MDLSLFDYAFPKELVAQHPPERRDQARLMVLDRAAKSWRHQHIPDFLSYIREGDVIVVNNAHADPIPMDGVLVPPLPPYIKRKRAGDFTPKDFERYRTVYASAPGSKAAPTAGFHLTEEILKTIRGKGGEIRELTLHVGFDTFKPIRTSDIGEHPMHGENFEIPPETAEAVTKAKGEGRRVIAVGTTTVRALESWSVGRHQSTNLFITPGYEFRIVNALLTNFHRPRSTVLVLVSAFAEREFILRAYEEAIREGYRLFSYGDAMLIF